MPTFAETVKLIPLAIAETFERFDVILEAVRGAVVYTLPFMLIV
jgi:hypothetical protein